MSLIKAMSSLFASQKHSDVTFVVEGKQIPAHRLVLASQSEYFEKLLFDNKFKEGSLQEIPIEAPLKAFELVMIFMYTAKLSLGEENVAVYSDLFDLSRRFGILSLENDLVEHFLTYLNGNNVVDLLNMALQYESGPLTTGCVEWIAKSGLDVLGSDKIKGIPVSCMKEILTTPVLKTTNMKKFLTLEKWLAHHPECLESDKSELTKLIDVTKLSNSQITQKLLPSRIFEKGFLLQVLTDRSGDVPEESDATHGYNFDIFSGSVSYDEHFHRQLIGQTESDGRLEPVTLKLHSMAYCICFKVPYGYIESVEVEACLDFPNLYDEFEILELRHYHYNGESSIYEFDSCSQPFKYVKIRSRNPICDIQYGLNKELDHNKCIGAKYPRLIRFPMD